MKVLVETSARHVHVTQETLEVLFGKGYQLTVKKMLSQPGQFASNQKVAVVGPKGELKQYVDGDITFAIEDGQLTLARPTEQKRHKAMHGLYRALIANMVKGVSEGFEIKQQVVGVGYKAEAKGQQLELSLGYSHNILFDFPCSFLSTTRIAPTSIPSTTIK